MRDVKSGAARSFALLSVFVTLWIVANYITNHPLTGSLEINDFANRIAYVAGLVAILCGLLFTYFFPQRRRFNPTSLAMLAVASLVILFLSATTLVSGEVGYDVDGRLTYTVGPFLILYIAYFVVVILVIAKNLLHLPNRRSVTEAHQARFVLVAFATSALLGLVLNVIVPVVGLGWASTRFGPLVTVILVGTVAYTIVKHGLFDIRLAAVRTIAYACVLLALSAVYYLFAFILSVLVLGGQMTDSISVSPVNMILALLLAFLFQPFKHFFDRTTDRIFYRNTYKSDEFFERVSNVLVSTTDLRAILERASVEIGDTLKAKQSFFFVYYAEDRFTSAGTRHHSRLPVSDARTLDQYFHTNGDAVVLTELLTQDDSIRRILVSHKVDLVMPLRRSNEIIGYLCLGASQLNGYVKRDIRALETITNELVIAIQNALSVQEVKEINATLQQRVDEATRELRKSNEQLRHLDETKDEFISMASHQLRTPLTSIKGYISMVLEGDMGKITPQQETVLKESFNSSERMVRLISDFLNVSRLQTGKFVIEKHPANLADVVEQEVSGLQVIAASHQMKLAYQAPTNVPDINIDEGKIRQVIMNFVDNAIYYSRPDSTIIVTLEKKDDKVIFIVSDTGIGVPEAEQSKLFAKFFRATNARKQRPDGTGVGLFLAKKVVTAHGGTMIFSSAEGKGSKFGFMIPVVQK